MFSTSFFNLALGALTSKIVNSSAHSAMLPSLDTLSFSTWRFRLC